MAYVTSTRTVPVDTETPQTHKSTNRVWWMLNRDAGETAQFQMLVSEFPPGCTHPLHRHAHAGEMVYVLEGEALHLSADQEPVRLQQGDAVYIPAGEWHGLSNAGEENLVVLALNDGVNHYRDAGYEEHPSVG